MQRVYLFLTPLADRTAAFSPPIVQEQLPRQTHDNTSCFYLIETSDDQLWEDNHRLRLKCQIHATVFVWSRLELECSWTNSDINGDLLR
jgi:CDP-glycerol glycerophosphotransferase (TagB/SpsB family)